MQTHETWWVAWEVSYPWKVVTAEGGSQGLEEDNIPIFKKNKEKDQGNYKLVGLTSIPGKVIEKIVLVTFCKYWRWSRWLKAESWDCSAKGKKARQAKIRDKNCKVGRMLGQVARRGCGISIPVDIQNLIIHQPEQLL